MVIRLACLSVLTLVLSIPVMAQNTKGDKPTQSRETRFKKTKKQKSAKRVSSKGRTTTSLRAYKPRKKSKGGERVGQSFGNIRSSRPGREGSQNTYPQRGVYVNNKSESGRNTEKRSSKRAPRIVQPRSATRSTRNTYPQSGRYVNYSSTSDRKPPKKKRTVSPRSASRSFISRRSINVWANFSRPRQRKERAYSGDIAGRRIRTRNFETKRPAIVNAPATARRQPAPRPRARAGNRNQYVSGNATAPRNTQRPVSNRSTLTRLKSLQSKRRPEGGRKISVVPRSASSPFLKRKSTNVWAHFPRPKRRQERAVTTDIAGKPLRTKNFQTRKPGLIQSSPRVSRFGDRPYKGPASGSYRSATRSGRTWKGDVARRRLIDRNSSSDRGFLGKAKPGGYQTRSGESRTAKGPIAVKAPKSGLGIGNYRGNMRGKKGFGNQGEGYSGNLRQQRKGFADQGEGYSGNYKSRRRPKGGGSVSGKLWNNNNLPTPVRTPGIGASGLGKYQGRLRAGKKGFNDQGEGFSGTIKSRRAAKGGGSVSGKLWNNNNQPNPVRTPGIGSRGIGNYSGNIRAGRKAFANQGEGYSGNIKSKGKSFADQGESYTGNIRSRGKSFADQGEGFSGMIRARRPAKGGGSVSGKLWNNNGTAIPSRSPSKAAMQAGGFPGKIRRTGRTFQNQGEEYTGNIRRPTRTFRNQGEEYTGDIKRPTRSFQNQGEEFSGFIKARRPAKGGGSVSGKLWNNNESPITVRAPKSDQGGEFRGNLKLRRGYVKNPNAAEEALKKNRPRNTFLTDGLQVRVQQHPYGKKPSAAEGSLPGWKPSKESIRASEFTKVIRAYKYVRNPSSADVALKVREPGKAFGRATDFQGNIKMKKFDLFGKRGLHPDAQFVKTNKNNVEGEKDMFTNFKLWWARLFKKSETQPGHLKDKGHKPRYDKGEQGLWYE